MRIPLSWLQEYVSITHFPEEIAKILTMSGIEVDHYETIGKNVKEIIVARVLESTKHPQADKLSLATVTDGQHTYQIVCGAPNCRAGIKVALARIGTTVSNGKDHLVIKKAKIRGVESEGMLCSAEELGLPHVQGQGIIEIPDDMEEGTSLDKLYADTFFDISLTPNLSHCTSVTGIARELGAATGQSIRLPTTNIQIENTDSIKNYLQVHVEDNELCPRYTCRMIKNIKIGPSPRWLKERLEKCGIRSVNNVVDVTNYVLLEMGHPLHAFDYDMLQGKKIIVRKAKEGEEIVTLDGKKRILDPSMLTISDTNKPVAIAGVMGELHSEIKEHTKTIVLESAYFDPASIRRTSKQLGLQTDASKRYERGTDPNCLLAVLDRAASLIQQVAGGEILSGIIDSNTKKFPEFVINGRLSRIQHIIGIAISRGEVEDIFKRLQFPHQWDKTNMFTVRVPTYRVDIKAEIDLIEEVARLYGYDNIPRKQDPYVASSMPSAPIFLFENVVRERLIAEGLQEFITCDLIGPSLLQIVDDQTIPAEQMITVLNPTSIEQSILRTSLLPGLLQVVKYNIDHQNHDIAGFEIGRIHFREGDSYKEQPVVGFVLTGANGPFHWDDPSKPFDFFDLKGMVENLLAALGIAPTLYKNIDLRPFHTGRQASIFVDQLEIGSIGEVHPAIQRRLDVSQRILFGECNLQDLLQIATPLKKTKPLAIYPGSERDWTFTSKTSLSFQEIIGIIKKQSTAILEKVSLKNIYRSEKLGDDLQNMTLHFVYRDSAKTIEQEEVEKEHFRITTAVLQELHDSIRIQT